MRILALIPARGGSKRLPRKNVRLLKGKPLINWSIESAVGVVGAENVIVSTDDLSTARIAIAAGATVPWLRPPALATDTASSVDVALHALDWFEHERGAIDGLLLLQPTSPFRRQSMIQRGCRIFDRSQRATVIGVSTAESHPYWCLKLERHRLVPYLGWAGFRCRSQDLPAAYVPNGSFFLITPARLRRQRSFYGGGMVPLVCTDPMESLDIDTPEHWRLALRYCRTLRRTRR